MVRSAIVPLLALGVCTFGQSQPGATGADADADDYEGTESYASFPIGGNNDRWATLVGWGASAEFDEVTIEQCP